MQSSQISLLDYLTKQITVVNGGAQASLIEAPKTDGELYDAVVKYVGIRLPDKAVCNEHSAPFEAFSNAYFARDVVSVWKASRGFGGKTVQLAILSFIELILLGASVNLLGGSGEQSARAYKYISGDETNLPDKFWAHPLAPRELILGDINQRITRLVNGGRLSILMASQKSVRGPHPQRLRIDEADEVNIDILDSALGQPMLARGIVPQTVISSTHQYPDGTMSTMLKRATKKGWPVFEWCYRETMAQPNGWLSVAEVKSKKKTVTQIMWDTEYEGQEPSPDSRAIQPDKLALMFREELGHYQGTNWEYVEIEPPMIECSSLDCSYEIPEPEDREESQRIRRDEVCPECGSRLKAVRYATGADWARKKDNTAILTFRRGAPSVYQEDKRVLRLVAFERGNKRIWPYMVGRLEARANRYWGRPAHDGTGVGDVVDGYINFNVAPVVMVGNTRADMFTEFIAAIERQEVEAPFIEFMEGEYKYCSADDLYRSGVKFHPPDTFVGGALAYHSSKFGKGVY